MLGGDGRDTFDADADDSVLGGDGRDTFDADADDSVLGGDGRDTFDADAGDFVSTVEDGPTPCEGGQIEVSGPLRGAP